MNQNKYFVLVGHTIQFLHLYNNNKVVLKLYDHVQVDLLRYLAEGKSVLDNYHET